MRAAASFSAAVPASNSVAPLRLAICGKAAAAAARAAGDGRTSPPVQGAVGSDRSGGYEDTRTYGEGAGSAAPAASKAYESQVVAQSQGPSAEDPLAKDPEKPALVDEREWEKETGSDSEGR